MTNLRQELLDLLEIEGGSDSDLDRLEYQTLENWDSLALLNLIGFIEQKTGKLLTFLEIEKLKTLDELEQFISIGD